MNQVPASKVLVVGLGNSDRGDDGVGPLVARMLAALLRSDAVILSLGDDVLSLVAEWNCFDAVICVDAAAPALVPGQIHRIDLAATDLPRYRSSASSHGLGLADAVALARSLNQALPQIVVYAIEGASFAAGAPMTPCVSAAARDVADRIVAEVHRLRRTTEEKAVHV
jgi:hydrogenase maturation protease